MTTSKFNSPARRLRFKYFVKHFKDLNRLFENGINLESNFDGFSLTNKELTILQSNLKTGYKTDI